MRRFGIEVEIAGISQERAVRALNLVGLRATAEAYNHTAQAHWKIVSDASVRGGFEVVSPVLEGDAGLEAARAAITALDDAGATINRTCGLHVHFDASSLSGDDIKMIVRRYAQFEEEIDAFMPPSRRGDNNQYCLSIKQLSHRPSFESADGMAALARLQGGRYYKLNLQSYHRHGTIEFRHHGGTVNAAKVQNWIRFLEAFITESCRLAREAEPRPATAPAAAPATSGKLARLYQLIDNGACLEEIMEALDWQRHTVRGAISRLRQAGAAIETQRQAGRTCYSLAGSARQAGGPGRAAAQRDALMNGVPAEVAAFYRNRAAILAM